MKTKHKKVCEWKRKLYLIPRYGGKIKTKGIKNNKINCLPIGFIWFDEINNCSGKIEEMK